MSRADHIKVKRWGGIYTHHGIDLGDGTCVHFTGEPVEKANAEIKRTSITEFLKDGELEIVIYYECKPANDVVATALKHIGEQGYNLIWNNCEHFASYCKTGQKESRQVKKATKVVTKQTAISSTGIAFLGVAGVMGAPVLAAAGSAYGAYKMFKWLKD